MVTRPACSVLFALSRWAGPELGEHTEAVLKQELGYSQSTIDELRQKGAI